MLRRSLRKDTHLGYRCRARCAPGGSSSSILKIGARFIVVAGDASIVKSPGKLGKLERFPFCFLPPSANARWRWHPSSYLRNRGFT